jgi:hypothetical protein
MSLLHAQHACEDFDRVRRQALFHTLLTWLCRRPNGLLAYHEVRGRLAVAGESYRGLRAVPAAWIVGSTDRCRDFDRAFRPRRDHCAARWLSVARAHSEGKSLPPVQLYQVGDAYFVRDGHHRVSVARARGQTIVEAEVVEVIVSPPSAPLASPPVRSRWTQFGPAGGIRATPGPRLPPMFAAVRALARRRVRLVPGVRGA